MKNKLAVGYIRMSTAKQDDSPAIQRANIIRHFGEQYEIVHWYEDLGLSGASNKHKRKQYLQMLADAPKAQWKTILVNNPARFTREDGISSAADKEILRNCGCVVSSVSDGIMDWTTSTGRIVDSVKTEGQHDYVLTLAKNCLDGKIKKAKEGKTFGQTTPYGLARRITDSLGNEIIVGRTEKYTKQRTSTAVFIPGDEQEIEVIRWLFSEYSKRDVSFHQLCRQLNADGVPSPDGGKWMTTSLLKIMKNVRYVGDMSFGVEGVGKFYRFNDGASVQNNHAQKTVATPIKIEATHEGIVDRKTFDLVQIKLSRKKQIGQKSGREEGYALTGVVICGKCRKPMYGRECKNVKKHRTGIRYSCAGNHRVGSEHCGQWKVHQDDILPFLLTILKEQIDTNVFEAAAVDLPARKMGDVDAMKKRIDKLQKEYDAGCGRFLIMPIGHPMADDLEKKLLALQAELEQLKTAVTPMETRQEWAKRSKAYWQEIKDKCVAIEEEYAPGSLGKMIGLKRTRRIRPSTIRELFQSIGLRLTLWFERTVLKDGVVGKRWDIFRAQVTTTGGFSLDLSPHQIDNYATL